MGRAKRAAAGGLVYHVLNRANARKTIFEKEADYPAFEVVRARPSCTFSRAGFNRTCGIKPYAALFGGVAELSQEPPRAKAEFFVAIDGPFP
jgi:hypothetical protein